MKKIYLYNNWHNGDVLTNRPLIAAVLAHGADVAVGSYRDRHYLVADLPARHVISPHREGEAGNGLPCLSALCPPGYAAVNTWCGTFPDLDRGNPGGHNWSTIVATFNRQSEQLGLGLTLGGHDTPMLDFRTRRSIRLRPGRAVYVENGPTRSGHSTYRYDVGWLARLFPEFTFYCTADPRCSAANVVDCGRRNLVELSEIGDQCDAVLGVGSGPFICTFTEANRYKPRAVMRFRGRPFWVYPNNPTRYLESDYELADFLFDVARTPVESL